MWVPGTEHSILLGHLSSPYFCGFAVVLGHCEWDGIPWSFSSTEKLGPSVHGGTYLNPNPSSVANLFYTVRPCLGGGECPKTKVFVVCPRSVSGGAPLYCIFWRTCWLPHQYCFVILSSVCFFRACYHEGRSHLVKGFFCITEITGLERNLKMSLTMLVSLGWNLLVLVFWAVHELKSRILLALLELLEATQNLGHLIQLFFNRE